MVVKEGQSLNLYADLQDVVFGLNTRAGVNDANRPQSCISSHERGYGFPRLLLLGSPVNRGNGSLLNAYTGLLQLARRGPELIGSGSLLSTYGLRPSQVGRRRGKERAGGTMSKKRGSPVPLLWKIRQIHSVSSGFL